MTETIKFDELPQEIKAIFKSRKRDCIVYKQTEFINSPVYYVRVDGENTKFVKKGGIYTGE